MLKHVWAVKIILVFCQYLLTHLTQFISKSYNTHCLSFFSSSLWVITFFLLIQGLGSRVFSWYQVSRIYSVTAIRSSSMRNHALNATLDTLSLNGWNQHLAFQTLKPYMDAPKSYLQGYNHHHLTLKERESWCGEEATVKHASWNATLPVKDQEAFCPRG